MNKVDPKTYIDPSWVLPKIDTPVEELMEKWRPLLEYSGENFQHVIFVDDRDCMIHSYMRSWMHEGKPVKVLAIEPEDRPEVAKQLEFLEQCCKLNNAPSHQTKWIIPEFRARLTEVPMVEKLHHKVFDVITELVLSDGGDGGGWIITTKDRYDSIILEFEEWRKTSKIKDWNMFTESDEPEVFTVEDGQEFVGICWDPALPNKQFGDYYIKI